MIIDLHQDISVQLLECGVDAFLKPSHKRRGITTYGNFGLIDQIDYPRLVQGEYKIIFGASCALKLDNSGISIPDKPLEALFAHINTYLKLPKGSSGKIKIVKTRQDLNKLVLGRVGIVLSIEGLYCINKKRDFQIIDKLYNLGVRSMGPLWSLDNSLGGGCNTTSGLTKLGECLVEYLNHKEIIIDGVHASSKSLNQILNLSKKPIIVSHTLSRTIHFNLRNLEDDHIKKICNKGGLIGVCFISKFSGDRGIDSLVSHIKHIVRVGSVNNIAIGSDFGAMARPHLIKDLEDASKINNLEQALIGAGFKEAEIEKIKWRNAFEFLHNNL